MCRVLACGQVYNALELIFFGLLEEGQSVFSAVDNNQPLFCFREGIEQVLIAQCSFVGDGDSGKLLMQAWRVGGEFVNLIKSPLKSGALSAGCVAVQSTIEDP